MEDGVYGVYDVVHSNCTIISLLTQPRGNCVTVFQQMLSIFVQHLRQITDKKLNDEALSYHNAFLYDVFLILTGAQSEIINHLGAMETV